MAQRGRVIDEKLDVLRRHCDAVGRDVSEIEVTALLSATEDSTPDDIVRTAEAYGAVTHGGSAARRQIVACLAPYLDDAEVGDLVEEAIRFALHIGPITPQLIESLERARRQAGLEIHALLSIGNGSQGELLPYVELWDEGDTLRDDAEIYGGPLDANALAALEHQHHHRRRHRRIHR